jgi:hypothetical protein
VGYTKSLMQLVPKTISQGGLLGRGRAHESLPDELFLLSCSCAAHFHNTIPAQEGDHLLSLCTSEICIHVTEPPKLVLFLLRRLHLSLKTTHSIQRTLAE